MKEKIYTKKVVFFGMPDMAIFCLKKLIAEGVNIVAAVPPAKTDSSYVTAMNLYKSAGVKIIEFDTSPNEPEFVEKIKNLDADIAVVCSFSKKFGKELLSSTKDGFINLHPSKLPDYRGGNPYSHVIINGEKESAITLHYTDENYDCGDIISQYVFPLKSDETMGTLFMRTNRMCAVMLAEALDYYETKEFPRRKQDMSPNPKKGYSLSFEKRNTFIDWSLTAEEVERFVRGLNPYIGALTHYKGSILRVNYAYTVNKKHNYSPGEIVETKNALRVACGEGMLDLDCVEFAGLYISSGIEFAKRENVKKGEVLGFE